MKTSPHLERKDDDMSTPQVDVAYEALSHDADLWDGVAGELTSAHGKVQSIEIYRGAFSFAGTAAADAYLAARETVLELLSEGATQAGGAATALRDIRNSFAANEAQTQADLAGVWEKI
jgi:hypothetical protein